MARMTNQTTGVVVDVDDETAALIGSDYVAESKPAKAAKKSSK